MGEIGLSEVVGAVLEELDQIRREGPIRTLSPRTNEAITSALSACAFGYTRPEQPGGELGGGTAQLRPLHQDRPSEP